MLSHQILISGVEIADLEGSTHEVGYNVVECMEERYELRAKGLSVCIPPIAEGDSEIHWHSGIINKLNNSFANYAVGDYLEARAQ
jgi:hypothetical protein